MTKEGDMKKTYFIMDFNCETVDWFLLPKPHIPNYTMYTYVLKYHKMSKVQFLFAVQFFYQRNPLSIK